jgi:hypothetical protein
LRFKETKVSNRVRSGQALPHFGDYCGSFFIVEQVANVSLLRQGNNSLWVKKQIAGGNTAKT